MGSSFRDQSNNMKNNNNNERSGNSSSKKGKNKSGGGSNNSSSNNNSDKPKQPQRGLGVAQLEKIRLHTQMASCGILPHPFFTSPFQTAEEEMMRYQAGYQGIPTPPPYGYSSPSVPSSAYGYQHPNAFMMGRGDQMERTTNMGYNESQACNNTARWNPNSTPESEPYTPQPGMITRHLLSHVEQQSRWSKMFESKDSNNQNSESSPVEELDLELKL